MGYRLFNIAVAVMWLAAMSALFMRDIWPSWSAQDSPPLKKESLAGLRSTDEQYGLYKITANGQTTRIGTAWNTLSPTADGCSLRGTVLVEGLPLVPRVRVETETVFDAEGGLDSFWLRVFGVPQTKIFVRGERHGIYFPCEIHLGPLHRDANLEISASRLIGDTFRPFSFLPTLEVGQSWRMQIVDPLAAVIGRRMQFKSIVARVTGMEKLTIGGEQVECFVVQTSPQTVKAWVNRQGRVLMQEVAWPGLGNLRVCDEPVDKTRHLRQAARAAVREGGELEEHGE